MADDSKVELKNFIQSVLKEKGMTMTELADQVGKSQGNVSTIIRNNRMNMSTFQELMNGMGEDVVILLKNGNKYNLEIK